MNSIVDVFPKYPCDTPLIKLSSYPEKNFAYWRYQTLSTGEQKQIFVFFMNAHNRVYYLKKQPSEKSDAAVLQIGKACQRFDRKMFNPAKINFEFIKKRLRKDPNEENRVNSDTRLAFKIGNQYLVKAYFTSGLRTVEPHTAHVIQTLRVPLLLYLYPSKRLTRLSADEKVFPHEELHLYDLSILPPMTVNRIPPGTKYVLLTVQKTFFTFDMVPENYKIPFAHRNPVLHRMTKLPGCDYLEKPVETPYIEQAQSDPEEEEQLQQVQEEKQQEQQQNTQEQPQFTFYFIPPQERSVVHVSMDFAEAYQQFKEKCKIESEPREKIPPMDDEIQELPLDFSLSTQQQQQNEEDNINSSSDLLKQATESVFKDEEMLDLDSLMDNFVEPETLLNVESEFLSELL